MMIKKLAIAGAAAAIFASSTLPAFAAKPADPNCLGTDVSGAGQAAGSGFGGFISGLASTTTGVGTEFLAHLDGVPIISSCPDGGFPTP